MSKHTKRLHEATTEEQAETPVVKPDHTEIRALAYIMWLERGCPIGSPEDDWYRAEEEFKSRSGAAVAAA